MSKYIDSLNEYLTICQQRGGINGIESVLEFLWECYNAGTPVDGGTIREYEEKLRPVMEALPYQTSNDLFDLIVDLCTAYQHAAFLEGLTLGARLHAELSSL